MWGALSSYKNQMIKYSAQHPGLSAPTMSHTQATAPPWATRLQLGLQTENRTSTMRVTALTLSFFLQRLVFASPPKEGTAAGLGQVQGDRRGEVEPETCSRGWARPRVWWLPWGDDPQENSLPGSRTLKTGVHLSLTGPAKVGHTQPREGE